MRKGDRFALIPHIRSDFESGALDYFIMQLANDFLAAKFYTQHCSLSSCLIRHQVV